MKIEISLNENDFSRLINLLGFISGYFDGDMPDKAETAKLITNILLDTAKRAIK